MKFRVLIYILFFILTSCNWDSEKSSTPDKYNDVPFDKYYNRYPARFIELPAPGITFTNKNDQITDSFNCTLKNGIEILTYSYPNEDSVYGKHNMKDGIMRGTVYKDYEDWVAIIHGSTHNVTFNKKDSTYTIYRSPVGKSFVKREVIKITSRYYERKLMQTIDIKDTLGEYVVKNPIGSRYYYYPHKDSIFPEYQYNSYGNNPEKLAPLYSSAYLYQPKLYEDWLVFKNSFQIRSYDSVNKFEVKYNTNFGYVFIPKVDYIKKEDTRILQSLLTEVVAPNNRYAYQKNDATNEKYSAYYNSKVMKIDSLLAITISNKEEYKSYKKQQPKIVYDKNIKRGEASLTLPIKNEPYIKVFKDHNGEYHIQYEYTGEIPILDAYIVEHIDPDFLVSTLVSKTTGTELITLGARPHISPNQDIIITVSPNSYENNSLMEIGRIKNGIVEILYTFSFPHWYVNYKTEVRWVNNNTFIIEATSPVHTTIFYENNTEKIEYLKINIKDRIFSK